MSRSELFTRLSVLERELNSAEPNRRRIMAASNQLIETNNSIELDPNQQQIINRQIRRASNFISQGNGGNRSSSSSGNTSSRRSSDNESINIEELSQLEQSAKDFIDGMGFPRNYYEIAQHPVITRDLLNDDLATAYWILNKSINPLTGQRIRANGPKYREYMEKSRAFIDDIDEFHMEVTPLEDEEEAEQILADNNLPREPFYLTTEQRRNLNEEQLCAYRTIYPYYSANTGRPIKIGCPRYIDLKYLCQSEERINQSRYKRNNGSGSRASSASRTRRVNLTEEMRNTLINYFESLNRRAGYTQYPIDPDTYRTLSPRQREFLPIRLKCAYFLLFPTINPEDGSVLRPGSGPYNRYYAQSSNVYEEISIELARRQHEENERIGAEKMHVNPKPFIDKRDLSSNDTESKPHDSSKVNSVCSTLFKEIGEPFKKYAELLQRYCSRVTSASSCKNIRVILSMIQETYEEHYQNKLELFIRQGHELEDIFAHYLRATEDEKKVFFKRPLKFVSEYSYETETGFSITLDGLPGSGIGLLNQVFAAMVEQIKNLGMFIPSEENTGSEPRYFINPDFVYENDNKHRELYRFVGAFYSFCVINNISIDFSLSRAYLYKMLSIKGVETGATQSRSTEFLSYLSRFLSMGGVKLNEDKLVTYFFLDFPVEGKSFLYYMRNPSEIPDDFLFNDDYKLVEDRKNKAVTAQTFKEYMRLKAQHQQYSQLHPGARNTEDLLDAFIEGFQFTNLNEVLLSHDVNIYTLDTMLSVYQLTPEVIEDFIRRISYHPEDIANVMPHKYLVTILRNFGRDFPAEHNVEGETESEYKVRQAEEFKSFFKKLIAFWSGNTRIDQNENQRYMLTTKEHPGLPTAAMCFKRLRFHIEEISYENFYKKLVNAVEYGWSDGTQLAGGAALAPSVAKKPARRVFAKKK
jgi:hypothetical protein